MKKLLFLAILALATTSFAAITSQVTFQLQPDDLSQWNFVIGIDDGGSDDYDSGLDANEPPLPPGPEVRMHRLGVAGASGGLLMDYRDGAGPIDASAAGLGTVDEVWGLGALDMGYPDLVTVDGANLGLVGTTHCVLTWDLSLAGTCDYAMYVIDDDALVALAPGGSYEMWVSNRFGIGPTIVIGATCAPIPEPGTMMLVGTGLLALVGLARRR